MSSIKDTRVKILAAALALIRRRGAVLRSARSRARPVSPARRSTCISPIAPICLPRWCVLWMRNEACQTNCARFATRPPEWRRCAQWWRCRPPTIRSCGPSREPSMPSVATTRPWSVRGRIAWMIACRGAEPSWLACRPRIHFVRTSIPASPRICCGRLPLCGCGRISWSSAAGALKNFRTTSTDCSWSQLPTFRRESQA